MKIPTIHSISNAFVFVCKRFPAAMLCAVVGVATSIYAIEIDDDKFVCLIMTALLGVPVFVGLKSFAESRQFSAQKTLIFNGLAAAALIGYYFWFEHRRHGYEFVEFPRMLGLLAVAHLWVSFAPYLNQPSNHQSNQPSNHQSNQPSNHQSIHQSNDFWEFNKQIFANIVVGGAYSLILWAGLSGAILAVDQLFDLHVGYKIYPKLWVSIAGIFNTAYFLFHYPKDYEFERSEIEFNQAFKVLTKYIFIPIVGLYFLILYAFSAKILFTWSLPHGWVSSLVVGFAAAGIFTWLLNFFLPETEDDFLKGGFKRWFWPVLFPMLGLLFVAVGYRIWEYGVTEPRFFVAHAGAWLTLCCVFYVFIKSEDLKFIPVSLAAFVLAAIFGPFSAFQSSERSQIHHLRTLLEKNGRLVEGKALPGKSEVSGEESERVFSILNYLENRKALGQIESWLPAGHLSAMDSLDYFAKNKSWGKLLNLKSSIYEADETNFSVWGNAESSTEIQGFERFLKLNLPSDISPQDSIFRFEISKNGAAILCFEKQTRLDSFEILSDLKAWHERGKGNFDSEQPIVFDKKGQNLEARFLLESANFLILKDTSRLTAFSGFVFLKKM